MEGQERRLEKLEKQAAPVSKSYSFKKVLISHGKEYGLNPKRNGEPFKEVTFQSGMTTFAYQQIFSGCHVENELRKNKTGGSEPIMELINESR